MASQPLNTTITVFRQLRGQRRSNWPWDTVKNLTGHMRPLELMVPGVENRTETKTRATTGVSTDFSSYMGAASATASRGMPIVVGPRTHKEFNLIDNLTGANAVGHFTEIGQDRFVSNLDSTVATSDLFTAAGAL